MRTAGSVDWREAGRTVEIEHHSELLARHRTRLPVSAERGNVAYHDPCYLGRYRGVYDEPRSVLAQSVEVLEAPRNQERSFCCGAGGGQMFLGEEKGKQINVARAEELIATGAETVAVACPFCASMFRDALKTVSETPPALLSISCRLSPIAPGLDHFRNYRRERAATSRVRLRLYNAPDTRMSGTNPLLHIAPERRRSLPPVGLLKI